MRFQARAENLKMERAEANETKRKNARICDKKTVEIIDALKIDTKNFDKFLSHEGVVARTILFDNAVKNLLETYPNALCVNIVCGLDHFL